jgi:hypothetical protein
MLSSQLMHCRHVCATRVTPSPFSFFLFCCLHVCLPACVHVLQECVDLLLTKGGPEVVRARDNRGDLPLHMAAQQGHPMCTYNLAKVRGGGVEVMGSCD